MVEMVLHNKCSHHLDLPITREHSFQWGI